MDRMARRACEHRFDSSSVKQPHVGAADLHHPDEAGRVAFALRAESMAPPSSAVQRALRVTGAGPLRLRSGQLWAVRCRSGESDAPGCANDTTELAQRATRRPGTFRAFTCQRRRQPLTIAEAKTTIAWFNRTISAWLDPPDSFQDHLSLDTVVSLPQPYRKRPVMGLRRPGAHCRLRGFVMAGRRDPAGASVEIPCGLTGAGRAGRR